MSDNTNTQSTDNSSDESLGLEQLPQSELEASPLGEDPHPPGLELDQAGIVTSKTKPTADGQQHTHHQ